MPAAATWTLASAPGSGAVAIIQLHGDIDAALAACHIPPVAVGEVKLRDLLGIDHGLVARWTPQMCHLMPHAGVAVVRGICAALIARGIPETAPPSSRAAYPEARSEVEAQALATLARAASPLAVDLLLAQHDLWSAPGATSDPVRDRILRRLINPPLVVALGASNIGKSTLVNTLAGRGVSLVADEPGTTRDHVGVMLDLAGLIVRYVDTPGLREGAGELETEAVAAALDVARAADLLLLCGDPTAPPPVLGPEFASIDKLTLGLRRDLGPGPFAPDVAVGAQHGLGITELVSTVRARLIPQTMLDQNLPWRFWA